MNIYFMLSWNCNYILRFLKIYFICERYPFDYKNPAGYCLCMIIQTTTLFLFAKIMYSVIILTIGFCQFVGFVLDLETNLREFNDNLVACEEKRKKLKNKRSKKLILKELHEERLKLIKQLTEIIRFHTEAKELSIKDFPSTFLICVIDCWWHTWKFVNLTFIWNSFLICYLLIGDWSSVMQTIFVIFVNMIVLYGLCYFGDCVTQRFDDVGDALYQLAWYLLSENIQRMLPTMIAFAQKKSPRSRLCWYSFDATDFYSGILCTVCQFSRCWPNITI